MQEQHGIVHDQGDTPSTNARESKKTRRWYDRWYWRFVAWLIALAVAVATLSATVTFSLYDDPNDLCNAKNTWNDGGVPGLMAGMNSIFIECPKATQEEAEQIIATYVARSAGSNPFRGWETLSLGLQSRWSYDAFTAQWDNIGYTEVLQVIGNETPDTHNLETRTKDDYTELPNNTFEVALMQYQLDPRDHAEKSQIAKGWLATYYYHIRLREESGSWAIDRVYSLDRTSGERRAGNYGLLRLATHQSTYSLPQKDKNPADKRWTNKKAAEGRLPYYCKREVSNGENATLWYRTSLGWVEDSDTDKTINWRRKISFKDFDGMCINHSTAPED